MNTVKAESLLLSGIKKQISRVGKFNKLLASGRKSVVPQDDLGSLSAIAKNKQATLNLIESRRNIQNNISFLQTQDGAMVKIGEIIARCAELKTYYLSPMLTQTERDSYDEEFRSLQLELREMKEHKFNGVSLFALEADPSLIEEAEDPNDLNSFNRADGSSVRIERTGIFDDLTGSSSVPVESGSSTAIGNADESRAILKLSNYAGQITWKQNPYSVTDHFKIIHGSEVIHEKVYGISDSGGGGGNPWVELYDSAAQTATRQLPVSLPAIAGERIDVIEFGRNGNKSTTMQLIVNEFGQTGSGTGWAASYEIEYDPVEIKLSDPVNIWKLNDFSLDDFERYLDVVSSARAQNAASSKGLQTLDEQYSKTIVGLEEFSSKLDDLDIARTVAELKKSEASLMLNFHFINQAARIDTHLVDDFLN